MELEVRNITCDHALDCLGEPCPLPIIKTAKNFPALTLGSVLEVLSDDPGILEDMEAWCASHSQDYLGYRTEDVEGQDAWRVYVRKRHN